MRKRNLRWQVRFKLGRTVAFLHKLCAQRVTLPLGYWWTLSTVLDRVVGGEDSLLPSRVSLSECLVPPGYATEALEGVTLSQWTLDGSAIADLVQQLDERQPATILEFGSGVSTLVLAAYCRARRTNQSTDPHVFSLEQDERQVVRTRQALSERKLDQSGTVVHAPVKERRAWGLDVLSYDINGSGLFGLLAGRVVDFLLIDGPAGPYATRVETLADVLPACSGSAYWLMDDAFRSGELHLLHLWSQMGLVQRVRVVPIGKGAADGLLDADRRAASALANR